MLAFRLDVTGASEIYRQSFPGGEGGARVSTGGGFPPRCRGDGRELIYVTRSGQRMAASCGAEAKGGEGALRRGSRRETLPPLVSPILR